MGRLKDGKNMSEAKATGYYSCGHVVLLSGFDDHHKKAWSICPLCHKGEMEEMHRLI